MRFLPNPSLLLQPLPNLYLFCLVLQVLLLRIISFLRFGYEVSFEALDKGAIEILGPYGISYTFRRLAERISQLQSGFVVRRVRYDPWPPAWSGGVLRCGSFVLPSLNYLLNIEFARYKISTNWDHKADWANGKGGVSRSAIDYRQTFPELQPSLSIQDTNNYLYHNHWHMRQVILIPYDEGLGLRGRNSSHYWVDQLGDKGFSSIKELWTRRGLGCLPYLESLPFSLHQTDRQIGNPIERLWLPHYQQAPTGDELLPTYSVKSPNIAVTDKVEKQGMKQIAVLVYK
ncbi:hypothetical protein RYX36_000551 [Vicia faba]